jgi:hypothetical protein
VRWGSQNKSRIFSHIARAALKLSDREQIQTAVMTDIATNDPARVPTATQADRPRRISTGIRRACDLLASGECKTVTAAAARVQMSREHLGRMLQQPHVRAFISRKSGQIIASASLRASTKLVELIDAESEHVAAQVSQRILTSEGILKSDQGGVTINNTVQAGYTIYLAEPTADAKVIDGNATLLQHDGQERDTSMG